MEPGGNAMTTLTPELIATLRQLSPEDKDRAIDVLTEDDGSPDEKTELREELQNRWDEYKAGGGDPMPVDDYLAELQRRIVR